jgi:hypothetical protein
MDNLLKRGDSVMVTDGRFKNQKGRVLEVGLWFGFVKKVRVDLDEDGVFDIPDDDLKLIFPNIQDTIKLIEQVCEITNNLSDNKIRDELKTHLAYLKHALFSGNKHEVIGNIYFIAHIFQGEYSYIWKDQISLIVKIILRQTGLSDTIVSF